MLNEDEVKHSHRQSIKLFCCIKNSA